MGCSVLCNNTGDNIKRNKNNLKRDIISLEMRMEQLFEEIKELKKQHDKLAYTNNGENNNIFREKEIKDIKTDIELKFKQWNDCNTIKRGLKNKLSNIENIGQEENYIARLEEINLIIKELDPNKNHEIINEGQIAYNNYSKQVQRNIIAIEKENDNNIINGPCADEIMKNLNSN